MEINRAEMSDLTFEEKYGIIEVKGYLFRYSDPQDKNDKDLHNQFWSKDTYLMTETFPIKGIPIMYSHSLKDEFTKVGIGVVNYSKEDDIGLFIKGEIYGREKWIKIVEEVNKRRKLGLNRKQIEDLAETGYTNIKSVVAEVPLQFSMGSYPPTYLADKKTGKIERAGIVEATLTPMPAEPMGTEAYFNFKSFTEFINLKEPRAKEDSEYKYDMDFIKQFIDNSKKVNLKQMDNLSKEDKMKSALNGFVKNIFKIMSEEQEEQMGESPTPEEETKMKSIIETTLMNMVERDTGFKNAIEENNDEAMKSVVNSIVSDNSDEIIGLAVEKYLDQKVKEEENTRKSVSSAFESYSNKMNQANAKSNGTGGVQNDPSQKGFGTIEVVQNEVGSLGEFFKGVATRDFGSLDSSKSMKAQNPYVGQLGGFLTGQEMADSILEPLRAKVVTFGMGVTETRVNNIGVYTRPKMTTSPSAYRPGINSTIGESEAQFETISAMLRPLACRVEIPRQMLMTTGTNVEQMIRDEAIRSLRLQIDKEILVGVGSVTGSNTGSEIKGVKRVLAGSNASATNLVTLGTGNGAKPKYDDLINAETQIAVGNVELDQETSGWIMHPRDRGTFRRTTGTDGNPLLYPNYSERPYEDLIGYKVATTTQIPTTQEVGTSADTSDIYFGNWRYGEYVIGNDIEVILDDMTKADQLMVRFIVYLYSDFIVHYPEAFYVMSGVRA